MTRLSITSQNIVLWDRSLFTVTVCVCVCFFFFVVVVFFFTFDKTRITVTFVIISWLQFGIMHVRPVCLANTDQPAHPCRLIRIYALRSLESLKYKVFSDGQ